MKIEIISGSPREASTTVRLARFLQTYLQAHSENEIGLIDVRETGLSPVQQVIGAPHLAPLTHQTLATRMFEADAFILVTPEYNGSYTADLKNLLDHFPKQSHKVFGLVTGSPGAFGGMRAALQLQQLVYSLFGIGSPHMLITPFVDKKFDADGNLIEPAFEKAVHTFVTEFLWLAEKIVDEKVVA